MVVSNNEIDNSEIDKASVELNLVKTILPNNYSDKKRNLYILTYSLNGREHFLNPYLEEQFNLIYLYYDLLNCNTVENGPESIISRLARIVEAENNAVVLGHSFNGYVAHQLACIVPQISYCVLIDTGNYFEPEKYKGENTIKELFANLLRQMVKNKDYTYPLYLVRGFYNKLALTKNEYETNISKAAEHFLKSVNKNNAIHNCIFFKASRSCFRYKHHGFSWKSHVAGNFYIINLIGDHFTILKKDGRTITNCISKIINKEVA